MSDNNFRKVFIPSAIVGTILFFALLWKLNDMHNDYECAQYIDIECTKYCSFNGSTATRLNTACNRLGNIK